MSQKSLKKLVFQASEGLLEKLTDFLLWYFFLVGASIGKNTRTSYQAFIEVDEILAQINYQSFRRAIDRLRKSNFLKLDKAKDRLEIEITRQGKERLKRIFPVYQEKRVWDKKLYLITYDIPENRHRDRDLLREYLRRIGCALLQESVWLTPYNPSRILAEFVGERGLVGTVLVSDLGPQGTVGGEDIKSLVRKVYRLDKLNEQYREFIDKYSSGNFSKTELSFAFLSILQSDPQLPLEILPEDWLGEQAYHLFRKK